MRILAFTLSLLFAPPALAGGVDWDFTVEAVQQDIGRSEIVVVLRPLNQGAAFPESCPKLRVAARLEREPFWRRTWSRELVTDASHARALEVLRDAAATQTPIRFGSMGTGLVPAGTDPCSTRSRGLAVLEDNDGTKAVYSFHDPI